MGASEASEVRIDRVGVVDLPVLMPMLRAYCDFYEVDPRDDRLVALCRALIEDPTEGEQAIARINLNGSHHTDVIVTRNEATAERFLRDVHSACVFHNVSSRFADGGEFGFGAEIGISTDKLHARGPMGLRELTSYQYRVRGNGQVKG